MTTPTTTNVQNCVLDARLYNSTNDMMLFYQRLSVCLTYISQYFPLAQRIPMCSICSRVKTHIGEVRAVKEFLESNVVWR